jgi:hypothetical protein
MDFTPPSAIPLVLVHIEEGLGDIGGPVEAGMAVEQFQHEVDDQGLLLGGIGGIAEGAAGLAADSDAIRPSIPI